MRWICLVVLLSLILLSVFAAGASESKDNGVVFNDFTLYIGDSINIGDYRAELVEIQSVKDGLVVMHVSKVGGGLDEQRALLQNSANDFDGGSDGGGITLTVTDIFDDQSAKVRVEYQSSLGTARKQTSEKPRTPADVPNLVVQKSFDRNQLSVGDDVDVTISVKNTGTGLASNIKVEDLPPLPEFSYKAGYPPRINQNLEPGESDSAVYVMSAVKEGSIRVPAIQVSYSDSKKNTKSNNSEPFNVIINPMSKPDLQITLTPSGPIPNGGKGVLNISLANAGKASATRIEISADIKPSEGLEAEGLEKSFFEIMPGKKENYSAQLLGEKAGNYTVQLRASFQGGNEAMFRESETEVVVLEREYKYIYLLLIVPVVVIAGWLYRRYKEYKY
jgi:uncharacterized repeat protein (TIGR01451 family)